MLSKLDKKQDYQDRKNINIASQQDKGKAARYGSIAFLPPPLQFAKEKKDELGSGTDNKPSQVITNPIDKVQPEHRHHSINKQKTSTSTKEVEKEGMPATIQDTSFDIPPILPEPSIQFNAAADINQSSSKTQQGRIHSTSVSQEKMPAKQAGSSIQLKKEEDDSSKGNVLGKILEPLLLNREFSMNKYYGIKSQSHWMIKNYLKSAKWSDIKVARAYLEGKSQKKLEALLINKMKIGDTITSELISSIYYVRNPFKAGLHLDLGLCLLTPKTEADILIRVLERGNISPKERKNLRADYDRTFMLQNWGGSNLSRTGFTQDIMKRFSHDKEKKILALLDHELTDADHLVHHITGDVDPKAALSIFTSTLERSGFKGIKKLEDDWRRYINTRLENVHYVFHKKPLFEAVKSTFGADSQVWQTIAPIEKNYRAWAFSENMNQLADFAGISPIKKFNSKKQEDELMLETAMKVIHEASISKEKGGNDTLSNIKFEFVNSFTHGTPLETKNYKEQILWAIRTVKRIMPRLIKESKNKIEKGVLLARWVKIKIQIDGIIRTSLKGNEKDEASLELNRDNSSSSPWVDDFYIAVQSGNKEKTVRLANQIWAEKKVDKLHKVLGESNRMYLGPEISGNARIRSAILVSNSSLFRGGGKLVDRGYRRLKYEIMEKKPDLNHIKTFILDAQSKGPELLDKSIAKFLEEESLGEIGAFFYRNTNDANKRQLLDVIKYRKYSKKVEEFNFNTGKLESKTKTKKTPAEFLKFSTALVPLRSNEEKIAHAEEYAKLQGNNGNLKEDLGELELTRMHAINDHAEGLEDYKNQSGLEDEAELMDISVAELERRYDESRRELEEEAAFFSFVVEMVAFGAIAILSGGSTLGLLAAAVASKAAGMGANELVLQEKYELFSEKNLKTLAVTGLTEVASLGVGSKFAALKKTEAFLKLSKSKQVAFAIAEQASSHIIEKGIESAVMGKLPEWDEAVLDLIIESIATGVKVNIDGIEDEKRFIRNAVVELIIEETPKEIGKAVLLSSIRGEDFDAKSFTKQMISSVTKKLSKAFGQEFKINKGRKEITTDEKDKSSEEEHLEMSNKKENSMDKTKGKRDKVKGKSKIEEAEGNSNGDSKEVNPHSDKTGDNHGRKKREQYSAHFPSTFLSIDLLHALRRQDSPRDKAKAYIENVKDWDLLLSSVNREDPIFKEAKIIRNELRDLAMSSRAHLRGDANTRDDSDMDFQYESARDLLEADRNLRRIYGDDYKAKYKVDLFVTADRIKNSGQIMDPLLRASTEMEMAQLSRMYDLLRLKKATPENDPQYAQIQESIKRLPSELRSELAQLATLEKSDQEKKWRELLIYSDQLSDELDALLDQDQKEQNRIDGKRREIDLVQTMINGLSADAYTAKSVFGGKNLDPQISTFTELSNHYTFVQKQIQKRGGLGKAGKHYEIYKYLNRALNTLKKNGIELSPQQEDLLRHSEILYGDGDDAIRDFYTSYFRDKSEDDIAKRLSREIEGLAKAIDQMEMEFSSERIKTRSIEKSKGLDFGSIYSLLLINSDNSKNEYGNTGKENKKSDKNESRRPIDFEEAKQLIASDTNIDIPKRWKKPFASQGKSIIVYRGFSRRAKQKMLSGVLRIDDDRGGGTMSRDFDAANDAVLNKVEKPYVKDGAEKGGVVKVVVPAEIWDLLVESKSISEDHYTGFGGDLSSTEIRINSNAAIKIINSLPQQLVEARIKDESRARRRRSDRVTAKMKSVSQEDKASNEERSNRTTAKLKAVGYGEKKEEGSRSNRPTAKIKAVGVQDEAGKKDRSERPTVKIQAQSTSNDDDEVGQKKSIKQAKKMNTPEMDYESKALDLPSDITIHKNSNLASSLGALALTKGRDVHFAPGKFQPSTHHGRELIGHELEHVKQQKAGRVDATKSEQGFQINDSPSLEKEADKAGEKFAAENSSSPFQLKTTRKDALNSTEITADLPFSLKSNRSQKKNEKKDVKPYAIGKANSS